MARLGQPTVIGDLLAGLVFGASFLGWYPVNDMIRALGVFGVVLLLFYAGLETHYSYFMRSLPYYGIITIGEAIAAFGFGYVIGILWGYPPRSAYFIGAVLEATSISVSVKTLIEIKKLNTPEGYTVMGIAVLDDLVALIIIVAGVSLIHEATFDISAMARIIIIAFLIWLAIVLGLHRFGNYLTKVASYLHTDEAILTTVLGLLIGLALIVKYVNLSPLVVAYAVGLGLSEAWGAKTVSDKIRMLAILFSTIFFITTTAGIDIKKALTPEYIPFYLAMIAVAFLGKLLGGGLTSFLLGYPATAALRIGIGLFPRAEFCLIAAYIGYSSGLLGAEVYLAAILITIATNFATPPLLKYVYTHGPTYQEIKLRIGKTIKA
ncbi:MAG: cation:proton antiporter [Staphylothermus sp.]|nr:cation:proton antiporter [Staphylothermus sp.]